MGIVGDEMERDRMVKRRAAGQLEGEVMSALWDADGWMTPRDVQGVVSTSRRPLAYNTVMTILVRLWQKGMVDRRQSGRSFEYRPHCRAGAVDGGAHAGSAQYRARSVADAATLRFGDHPPRGHRAPAHPGRQRRTMTGALVGRRGVRPSRRAWCPAAVVAARWARVGPHRCLHARRGTRPGGRRAAVPGGACDRRGCTSGRLRRDVCACPHAGDPAPRRRRPDRWWVGVAGDDPRSRGGTARPTAALAGREPSRGSVITRTATPMTSSCYRRIRSSRSACPDASPRCSSHMAS